ncbi:MAG: hypothetical protein WC558_09185 [Patulibacter sp.]
MARNDRTDPVDEEPKRRGRLFWICLLVLLMILVWTALKPLVGNEGIQTVVAIVAGGIFVYVFRDKIWGEDWREQLAAERAKAQRDRRSR